MAGTTPVLVAIDLCRVIINENSDSHIVFFKEVGSERKFPFVLGIFEASSITRVLEGTKTPRPLTHDAWLSSIVALGGRVEQSVINRLEEHTYYAEIHIRIGEKLVRLDVRPSDAVIIALKAEVPILVNSEILERVAQ
jgi:bifunctional DNase/RNase